MTWCLMEKGLDEISVNVEMSTNAWLSVSVQVCSEKLKQSACVSCD